MSTTVILDRSTRFQISSSTGQVRGHNDFTGWNFIANDIRFDCIGVVRAEVNAKGRISSLNLFADRLRIQSGLTNEQDISLCCQSCLIVSSTIVFSHQGHL